jgi:hypothetical protein
MGRLQRPTNRNAGVRGRIFHRLRGNGKAALAAARARDRAVAAAPDRPDSDERTTTAPPPRAASAFLLSTLSAVWRAKLCGAAAADPTGGWRGGVRAGEPVAAAGRLELERSDAAAYHAVVDVACGAAVRVDGLGGPGGVLDIGRVADKCGRCWGVGCGGMRGRD